MLVITAHQVAMSQFLAPQARSELTPVAKMSILVVPVLQAHTAHPQEQSLPHPVYQDISALKVLLRPKLVLEEPTTLAQVFMTPEDARHVTQAITVP